LQPNLALKMDNIILEKNAKYKVADMSLAGWEEKKSR